jgi:tetratricopeptide (TPR) repeat protein
VIDAPSSAGETASTPSSRTLVLLALACLALTALPFLFGLSGTFVYDDLAMVVRNPHITSFSGLPAIFARPMFEFLDPEQATKIGYWRPLAGLALAASYAVGKGSPLGFHVVSLLLHLAATAVAFRLALRLSKNAWVAFFAALLFGLHPTKVEAVSWISAMNDPLFGLFALLALDAFARHRERESDGVAGVAWPAALWFLLALLSKEAAVAVVPMALALDLGRLAARRESRIDARAYVPMAAALALYYLARVAVFGSVAAGFDRTTTDFRVPPLRLFEFRFEVLGGFLWLLAWPAKLNLFRPFRPFVPFGDPDELRAFACVVVLALLAFVLWKRRAGRALAWVLLVPAAVLPILVRVQSVGAFTLSDRFLYLPAFGWGLVVAAAAFRWLPRSAASILLAVVAIAYGVRAQTRTGFWRDEDTLFRTAALESPESAYVHWGCSRVLLEEYRKSKSLEVLGQAYDEAEAALDLLERVRKGDSSLFATSDDHVQSNLCLAWCLLCEAEVDEFHDYQSALKVFEMIVERYPESPYAQAGLGAALMQLGRYDEAEAALQKAIERNPNSAEAHHNLGVLEMRRRDPKKAAAAFADALRFRPDSLEDLVALAQAQAESGDRGSALATAARAQEKHPSAAGPLVIRGTLAAASGDMDEALRLYVDALARDPDDANALLQKGKVLYARGQKESAKGAFLRAAELSPASFEIHYNTGALLLETEGTQAALPYLLRAYALRADDAAGHRLRDTLLALPIEDPGVLAHLAAADADRGDRDGALAWVERALEKEPEHGPSLYLKARLLADRGDVEAAETYFRKACEAMPTSFEAHERLGQLLVKAGRAKEAIPFLEKGLAIATASVRDVPGGERAVEDLKKKLEEVKAGAQ